MIIYLYDTKKKSLTIGQTRIGMVTDEEQARDIAEADGMDWKNVTWGYVENLQMELNEF